MWAKPASQVGLQAVVCSSGLDPGGCTHYQAAAAGGGRCRAGSSY